MEAVIRVRDLSKFFGKHRGIEGVNLTVQQGDFYGFIGPNGAGKSTTIRILLGLLNKSGGRAQVLGQTAGPNQLAILNRVGYMPAEAILYPDMKVKEIIRFSGKLHGHYQEDEVRRLAVKFDLDLKKKVKELSLGNRKKISIINALQHQPELYILDEPTSGLDPLMQQLFWEEITDRHRNGATVFVSSHVLTEVRRYCQKAAIIREGRIIVEDTMPHLIEATVKQVHIQGLNHLDMSGMTQVTYEDDRLSFIYRGDLNVLLSALYLHQEAIQDVTITQPDIEDVFMHYYREGQTEMTPDTLVGNFEARQQEDISASAVKGGRRHDL